ncbi:hypothetical protein MNBD_GAMMA01-1106 [hydrothermal vent metagenome]|uniref:Peptidase S54 rhomboid domain-containing protein n=1 Tax=hydrothermal vent metagenome TaxID=652676 RepID=A0A3B0WFD9_9ZZZZ
MLISYNCTVYFLIKITANTTHTDSFLSQVIVMLKFKSKNKLYFPKFSILIWITTLLTMVWMTYYPDRLDLNRLFAINPSQLADNLSQSWWYILQLSSALLLHGNWQHWAGNMILFLIIALPLEKRVNGFWFVLIYFVAGFAGNLSSIYQLGDSVNYLLGASGAVSGLFGAWLILFPTHKISVIIPIGLYMQKAKIPVYLLALVWLSIQIVLQIINPHNYLIVWSAHIVGFIVGFFVAWLYRVIN